MKRGVSLFALLVFATIGASSLLAQDNPFLGTWKLNVAKSKFNPGPAPKSQTRTIVAQGDGAKYSFDGMRADGSPAAYSFATNYDGKDSAVTGSGMPGGADTIALKRINSHKVEAILKRGGKEIGKSEAEVSKDGKVATVKSQGTGPEGKAFSNVSVYDKR
jgi:hypothetical protein